MSILSDIEIAELCTRQLEKPMIEPFHQSQIRTRDNHDGLGLQKVISYGLSSYGYDICCADEFKVFTNINNTLIDPKNFDSNCFVDVSGKGFCIIPPNSFALARTVEYFRIPRNVLTICVGKSTYARCFTGDTKVRLVDGTTPNFIQLVERYAAGESKFYGYGWINGKYVAQVMTQPRLIGHEKTYTITLDNHEIVKCTGDHLFYLRSGETKEAKDLISGDSLLPLYLHDSHGYESIYDPINRTWQPTHLAVRDMLVRLGEWGEESLELDVHHRDYLIRNNHPDNLQALSEVEHAALHNQFKDLSAQAKKYWSNPDSKAAHLAILHAVENRKKADASRSEFYATSDGKKMLSSRSKTMWANASDSRRNLQREIMATINRRQDITEETVTSALLLAGTIRGAANHLQVDRSAFRRFPHIIEKFKAGVLDNNHKVISVVEGSSENVYCLSAETGNFALDCGVIVSNCGIVVNVTPFEPEWEGYVTLEFSNTTPLPAKIYANEGCAQVLFFKGAVPCSVSYKARSGKYQGQTGVTLPRA